MVHNPGTAAGHNILDAHLWIRQDLDHTAKANTFAHTDPGLRAHLARQLLLYDQLVMPTHDFGIVPILIAWMGLDVFRESITTNSLRFIRIRPYVGYAGGGRGLSPILIEDSPNKQFDWWQLARFGPIAEAVDVQLRYQLPWIGKHERSTLRDLVESQTSAFEPPTEVWMRHVCSESYEDVLQSRALSDAVGISPGAARAQLAGLLGVEHNQIRVAGAGDWDMRDGIDILLVIAEINTVLVAAQQEHVSDLVAPAGSEQFLHGKMARAGADINLLDAFQRLLDLAGIPDIGPPIVENQVTVKDIWQLRQKRASVKFREWLRSCASRDPRELEQAYVEALGKKSWVSSLPMRMLRFVVTRAVGTLNPTAGGLASAGNLFVDRWLRGYSPKMFIDDLRKLPSPGAGTQGGNAATSTNRSDP